MTPPAPPTTLDISYGNQACSHFTASPTPFHNCSNLSMKLTSSGFVKISEADKWTGLLKPGGKYFYTRNTSTIVAFVVGGKAGGDGGEPVSFKVIGGHTDSPNLRIKVRCYEMR